MTFFTAFSSFRRSRVISLPQRVHTIRTSLPLRMTLKSLEPHGCGFFSSSMSFAENLTISTGNSY